MGVADRRLLQLNYQPGDGVLDCKGPLSDTIAPNTLAKVNKEVKLATTGPKKKRGSYLSFTPTEKARVSTAVTTEFEQLCDDLAESR